MLKNLEKSFCVTLSNHFFDPSNSNFVVGLIHKNQFSLLSSTLLIKQLKVLLLFLEKCIALNYKLVFISNIQNVLLKKNFSYTVRESGHYFFDNFKDCKFDKKNIIIISLFLSSDEYYNLKKECHRFLLPLVGIAMLDSNNSGMEGFHFSGSLKSFESQYYILSLFSVFISKFAK